MPLSASSFTTFHTSMRASGSSPVVGSSRKRIGGVPTRLMARSSLRRIPPEYVDTRRLAASVKPKRVSKSSATWRGCLRCRSLAIMSRFSCPVNISSTAANCPVRLKDCRTWSGFDATSNPLTMAVPPSCLSSVVRILIIVVLPAPLEPSRAKMLPCSTLKLTPFKTLSSLYDFCRSATSMELVCTISSLRENRHLRYIRSDAFERGIRELIHHRAIKVHGLNGTLQRPDPHRAERHISKGRALKRHILQR